VIHNLGLSLLYPLTNTLLANRVSPLDVLYCYQLNTNHANPKLRFWFLHISFGLDEPGAQNICHIEGKENLVIVFLSHDQI
jgi:hypothetical protein